MSNRKASDTFERCTNTNARGVCMYVGPCLECSANRGRAASRDAGEKRRGEDQFDISTTVQRDQVAAMQRRALDGFRDAATSQLQPRRGCDWCAQSLPKGSRQGHRFCNARCRQNAQRFRVDPASPAPAGSRRMRFAYADPPYPGLARRYYDCDEVDHGELVLKLAREYPDGWALSTSADALQDVLALIPRVLRPRTNVWDRTKPRSRGAIRGDNRWEPLIVVGGRATRDDVEDLLAWGGRQHSHPKALVGMKPAAFCEWMFRLLGAARGDELVDLFPGSGAVGRAWRLFTSELDATAAARRFRPGRFAGATAAARDVRR